MQGRVGWYFGVRDAMLVYGGIGCAVGGWMDGWVGVGAMMGRRHRYILASM